MLPDPQTSYLYRRTTIEELKTLKDLSYSVELYNGKILHSGSEGNPSNMLEGLARQVLKEGIELTTNEHKLATLGSSLIGGLWRNQVFLPATIDEMVEFLKYYYQGGGK